MNDPPRDLQQHCLWGKYPLHIYCVLSHKPF